MPKKKKRSTDRQAIVHNKQHRKPKTKKHEPNKTYQIKD